MSDKTKIAHKPTYRQMMALDIWLKTGRKSKAAALREAGYGRSIVRRPHKVFESPAVLRELEIRGLDSRGMRNELREIIVEEVAPKETIHIDFSKMAMEQRQLLKERLAEIYWIPDPFARKEETVSLNSTTASIAVDQEQQQNTKMGDTFSL